MAGGASWGSVLSTLVTYLQRLGINVSLDSIPLPDKMKEIISSVYMFYETVQSAIPSLPDFDLRSQLMVLALAIPFVLDVVFVWFINPIGVTLTHVLDLVAFGVGTYFITSSIIGNWTLINISIIAICAVFIVLRIVFTFLTKQKGDLELYVLVDEICNYYMQGILPEKKCELSFRDLNLAIHKFSQIIEIVPPKANLMVSYSFLLVSFACFFLSFWCMDAFPIPYDFPDIITLILPIVGIPLGVIFFIIYVLRLFHCGRYFLTLVKQFIRRWGLRVLLMVLDLLYIPILTVLITMITPTHIGCPENQYLYYQVKDKDNIVYPFVNHTASCRPCVDPEFRSQFCERKCSGMTELRMKQAPDLLFVDDVIVMTGGLILYTTVIVMLGLPFLWWYIIKRNHMYVNRINVYGATEEIKYRAIIHRLRSTGVFLFQDYRSRYAMWGVVLILMKFCLMVFSVCQETFSVYLVWVFPFFYAITFTAHVYFKPYLYLFNTIFESIMEAMNLLFAVFTIVAFQGLNIPESVTLPLSIILLIVPVLSVLFILCCEGKEGTKADLSDPTIIRKADTKKIKEHHHEHITEDKKKKESSESSADMAFRAKNTNIPIEDSPGKIVPVLSGSCLPPLSTEYYKPNTSRAHYHPTGHLSRPATPLVTVSGVPSRYPTRPQTARIFDSDSDYDSSDSSYDSFVDPNDGNGNLANNVIKKKRKHRHHHYHDEDRIEVDKDGNEVVISNRVELEEGMLDSIIEFKLKNYENRTLEQIAPDELPIKECFTIRKKSAARRMTKMYKTLDVVLDGSTIDRLTKILNNAVIIGVIAVGWYLGALMTSYEYASNFTCG
ncbi:hypothetical protein TRFO_32160 [Tritrichomonas foetus]|uniref:Uncharacterized protein n=1 Tax=Tritrichomonas foetus TaxID=1144522 RepID=A0A1J4JPK1_9EUKA|nr:hypothetical protein TRFO_32160 [Tritrichomonas foetus]|eukprot:OHT00955.1 hypothetical protein TRFO_32160 [Tritrichomonas foetus]